MAAKKCKTSRPPYWEFYRDEKGEFRFRLKSPNGKIICAATESYVDRRNAERGLQIAREGASAEVRDLTTGA